MASFYLIFFLQICLLKYVTSQSLGNPGAISSGFNMPHTPGLPNGLPANIIGQPGMPPGGLVGPGMGLGLNMGMGNQGMNMAMANQGGGVNMGMANQALGMQQIGNQINGQVGYGNTPPAEFPSGYGGSGTGDVAVAGELPVVGTTAVNGNVPITGSVQFGGSLPAGGTVTISGTCGCGCNGPSPSAPPFGNNPYGY